MRSWLVSLVIVGGLGATGCREAGRTELRDLASESLHDAELAMPIPIISVGDLKQSQRYFKDVLGFKVEWEHGEPPDFSAVSRAHARFFLCQRCQGHPGSWSMIFSKDVDRLHREFVKKKAVIRKPPTDMPWHLREMWVDDPDGNVFRFATSMKH